VVPGTGDTANVMSTHTVTIAAPVTAILKIIVYGTLVINDDITIDDGYGYIYVNGGYVTTNATAGSPRYITSAGGVNPTYKWYFCVRNYAGEARRVVNLNNVIMSGNWWYLGKSTTTNEFVSFNSSGSGVYRVMLRPSPIVREMTMNEHLIDGRSYGRVYPKGMAAGRCTVRGYLPYGDPQYWNVLENLKSTTQRVSLTTDVVHMGRARVESLRWGEVKGNNLPFTMVLVEDL
jgi:hypothetical protein